jgi:hypothetical protein
MFPMQRTSTRIKIESFIFSECQMSHDHGRLALAPSMRRRVEVKYKKVHLFGGSGFGFAAFPNGQASLRTRGGGVNGRAVQGGIQGARKRAVLLTG